MSVKNFQVRLVDRSEITEFIENWHYSKSINGVKSSYCFGLYDDNKLIGAMLFGTVGMANAWKKYAENESEILELRRLCCIDDTPKNTESYFIGKCLRYLKKETSIKYIVSYADTNHGHRGTIYKASNFEYKGMTNSGRVIMRLSDGKQYHDKTIRTYYKGKLKPFAQKIKDQLENGEAVYKKTTGKHIYFYTLK
jgi:hypothetical protein